MYGKSRKEDVDRINALFLICTSLVDRDVLFCVRIISFSLLGYIYDSYECVGLEW